MGYYGRLELKNKAQNMRRNGKSYSSIMNELKIPKTTVSDWCKHIILSEEQKISLYASKKKGALKGSYIAAELKKKKSRELRMNLYESGITDVGNLSFRDRFIAGISLYAAEGTKTDNVCCFSNSDPFMIKFMVDWFEEYCGVHKDIMKGAIWLHDSLDEEKAKLYWSDLTGIPLKNFYKTYRARNKIHSKKIRKKLHNYGIFSFYINNVAILRQMMGWIGGILNKPWYNTEVH